MLLLHVVANIMNLMNMNIFSLQLSSHLGESITPGHIIPRARIGDLAVDKCT